MSPFPPINFFINFWFEGQTQGSVLWAKTLLLPHTFSLSCFSSDVTMTMVMDSGLPLLSIQKFIITEIFVKPSLHTAHSLKWRVAIWSSQHSMTEHGRQDRPAKERAGDALCFPPLTHSFAESSPLWPMDLRYPSHSSNVLRNAHRRTERATWKEFLKNDRSLIYGILTVETESKIVASWSWWGGENEPMGEWPSGAKVEAVRSCCVAAHVHEHRPLCCAVHFKDAQSGTSIFPIRELVSTWVKRTWPSKRSYMKTVGTRRASSGNTCVPAMFPGSLQ